MVADIVLGVSHVLEAAFTTAQNRILTHNCSLRVDFIIEANAKALWVMNSFLGFHYSMNMFLAQIWHKYKVIFGVK